MKENREWCLWKRSCNLDRSTVGADENQSYGFIIRKFPGNGQVVELVLMIARCGLPHVTRAMDKL
jgi:hypothetical protein